MLIHYGTHIVVGWSVYAAGRTFDRRLRVAYLALACLSVARLHVEHHPRRTP